MTARAPRLLIALTLLLALAGCGGQQPGENETSGRTVELPDGRSVTCVVMDGYESGGIDCDWGSAR